jgi:glycosyltransferase involved in cell wall biosynthesis
MSYSLGIGGSERQLTEVAKAVDRDLFEVHVGCLRAGGMRAGELRADGIPILELPVTSFASASALAGATRLLSYIRREGIRLVHSFDVPLNIFAAPVAWLARKPVVLTSQRAHRSLTPGLYHRLLRITDRMADGIVVNCEYMQRHLMEDERVPAGKIHLCYNGIDLRKFGAGPRAEHPVLAGASVVIGTVCALRPEKGLGTLAAAFAEIARDDDGARLVIAGSGPELPRLQAQVRDLGVSERCAFIPETDRVPDWLRAIDIFVMPSLSEAFSNSLMEAMACGCCAVASRVGGNPELIGGGDRGGLFEAGQTADLAALLRRLIEDPARRMALGGAAREYIQSGFSIERSVAHMQRIYIDRLSR